MEYLTDYTLIAALVAAGTSTLAIIVQIFTNWRNKVHLHKIEKMRIEANIIAKSRIEWIQILRELLSEYIITAYSVRYYSYLYKKTTPSVLSKSESLINRNLAVEKALKCKEMLLLNLSDTDEHRDLIQAIDEIYMSLIEYQKSDAKEYNELREKLVLLRNLGRDYLKKEWEKAKSGK